MLFEDWTFLTLCASAHILSIPILQHFLGLKSTTGIFFLHYLGQIIHHTSLKRQGRHFVKKYGYLNAGTPRSQLSLRDATITRLLGFLGAGLRIASLFTSAYKGPEPFVMSKLWVARLACYILVMDFFFYWCHRFQHTNKFLYKYMHSKHHTMTRPKIVATIHDSIFEKLFNTFMILTFTNWIVPMSFWDLHATYYVIHLVETFGHSGIAAHLTNPFLPFFSLFGIDLSIEDHDLHHRKLVGNFGKQTRAWDKLFGTYIPRQET